MNGINYTSLFVLILLIAAVVGWSVIEGLIWIIGSMNISWS